MSPFWSTSRHRDRRAFLHGRALIAKAVRQWFWTQGFVEAEPDGLVFSPGAEVHVDAFESDGRYLHTSPELAMKKLLAAGEERIFFLGKCWRRGETGPLHAEEFTMLEWYRAGAPYTQIMDDCIALVRIAARVTGIDVFRWKDRVCDPSADPQLTTVREAFLRHAAVLPATSDEFSKALVKDIEPNLGAPALTLLHEYPLREAALAQRTQHDPSLAERFELYACGVELANGFVKSEANAARTNGVSSSPATSGRFSRNHARFRSVLPNPWSMTRVSHIGSRPPGASRGTSSAGPGTCHAGGLQTVPPGFSARLRNTALARAIEASPEMNSASTTRMRFPSRATLVRTSAGANGGRR
ncbi:hypothetical protein EDM76_13505 [bacterium]|nr:MAG: hypothetical protein EDM76_13505 [bacterium]